MAPRRPIRLSIVSILLFAVSGSAEAAAADDVIPPAGLIEVASNPCLLAKSGYGEPCPEPQLPKGDDVQQLIAAHLERARFFMETYALEAALREVDAALDLDQANAQAHHLAARLAMSVRDLARAEREIMIALRQSPDDVNIRATNAVRLQIQPEPQEALREFNEILAQHPDHVFSRETRARLLLSMGRLKESIGDLNILLAEDHPKTVLWSLRATAYLRSREPGQAIADLTRALEDQPGRFDLLTERATAYELAGDDSAALRDFDAILGPVGSNPNYAVGGDQLAKIRTRRAFVLVRLKRSADAAAEMASTLSAGGRPALLRAQLFLRQNGFPQVPLDGRDSDSLRTALQACFGLNSCFSRISEEL